MIYSFNLSVVDLVGLVMAIFVLGLMAGHKFLPRPIDTKKEQLIDQLFNENMALKIEKLKTFDPELKQ